MSKILTPPSRQKNRTSICFNISFLWTNAKRFSVWIDWNISENRIWKIYECKWGNLNILSACWYERKIGKGILSFIRLYIQCKIFDFYWIALYSRFFLYRRLLMSNIRFNQRNRNNRPLQDRGQIMNFGKSFINNGRLTRINPEIWGYPLSSFTFRILQLLYVIEFFQLKYWGKALGTVKYEWIKCFNFEQIKSKAKIVNFRFRAKLFLSLYWIDMEGIEIFE